MLPKRFAQLSPSTGVPVWNTLVVSVAVALLAGFIPLDVLANLTSLGTLVAFCVVSIGVIVLRRTNPGLQRGFKVPGFPVTPLLSIAFCVYLIQGLPLTTFELFAVWLAGAACIYFGYSIKHSRLRENSRNQSA
jgi:APA family basic amino acid/polyamine antiporter